MNNSRILTIKNAKFSGYHFYMNLNIKGDFQICISVPLSILINSCFPWNHQETYGLLFCLLQGEYKFINPLKFVSIRSEFGDDPLYILFKIYLKFKLVSILSENIQKQPTEVFCNKKVFLKIRKVHRKTHASESLF